MELLKIKDMVELVLVEYPKARDNDNFLVCKIWYRQNKEMCQSGSAMDLLVAFSQNKLISIESITRCRRKIQELRPELRGTKYHLRQKEQETVKNQLKQF